MRADRGLMERADRRICRAGWAGGKAAQKTDSAHRPFQVEVPGTGERIEHPGRRTMGTQDSGCAHES